MNKKIIILSGIMICLLFSSCKEEETPTIGSIDYPESGFFGDNILNLSDTIYEYDAGPSYGDGNFNSLKAVLPNMNSSLTVEITGTEMVIYKSQGWISNWDVYTRDSITFRAEGSISADLQIYLLESGTATIKIFENDSDNPTRVKVITKEN